MKKFVVVVNKSHEINTLLSAIGHVTAGLSGNTSQSDDMNFIAYVDSEGNSYPNISEWPFIVLKTNGGKLKTFRDNLIESEIPYSCYLDTMLSGGSEVQVEETSKKKKDDLTILALATFGDTDKINELTKKFSLYR